MTSSNSLTRVLTLGVFTLAFAGGLMVGCSETQQDPVPDAGTVDPDVDAGGGDPDGGSTDGGKPFRCRIDDDCAEDKRCDDATGDCIAAEKCQDDPSTCPGLGTYCDNEIGLGCRCAPSSLAESPYNGFCKRRRPACSPCETDAQCGDDPNWFQSSLHEPGKCVLMPGETEKRCLELFKSQSKCSCGKSMQIGSEYFCAPQDGKCGEDGTLLCCTTDAECPPEYPACDQSSGRCVQPCTYDFAKEQTVNCRSDQVCNVDPQFLDPNSLIFGAGRCAAPCKGDPECKQIRSDFVCKAEKGSAPRCRPAGCVSDHECPVPAGSFYRGYCEQSTGQCKTDTCRRGTDPFGNAYQDCVGGYKCDNNNKCVEQTCVEQGGAENACNFGEFCCGEDRNGNGNPNDDPCTNSAGVVIGQQGKCYKAPNPPWCKSCSADTECVGGGAPSSTTYPNLCLDFGNGPTCVYACTLLTQCPRGFACGDVVVDCSQDASVCGDAARCKETGRTDQNGNPIKQCTCTAPGTKGGECPNAVCGQGRWCVRTQGCIPGGNVCQ